MKNLSTPLKFLISFLATCAFILLVALVTYFASNFEHIMETASPYCFGVVGFCMIWAFFGAILFGGKERK